MSCWMVFIKNRYWLIKYFRNILVTTRLSLDWPTYLPTYLPFNYLPRRRKQTIYFFTQMRERWVSCWSSFLPPSLLPFFHPSSSTLPLFVVRKVLFAEGSTLVCARLALQRLLWGDTPKGQDGAYKMVCRLWFSFSRQAGGLFCAQSK